jgi:hypothetical protein
MHKRTTNTFSSLSQKHNDGFSKPKKGYVVPTDDSNGFFLPKRAEKKQTELVFPATAQQLRQTNNKRKASFQENPIDEDDDFQNTFKLPTKVRKPPRPNIFAPRKSVIDDSGDFRNKLKIPKKTNSLADSAEKSKEILQNFNQAKEEDESDADKVQCPFCSEYLTPLTRSIDLALAEIHEKDKKYEQSQREKEHSSSSFSRPMNIVNKRPVLNSEKDAFCKLHKLELVIKPAGVRKGYPTKIAFEKLGKRIESLDEELKDVIHNAIPSDYRKIAEEAYKELGVNKARSTTSIMHRFEKTLPGYYGPKGSNIILEHLTRLYLNTGYLKRKLVSDQLPLEFLQQVLVPETGYRLIRQDLCSKRVTPNATEKAKTIMNESRDYGSAMFPIENQDIEESINDTGNSIIYNLLDDDESEEEEENGSDNYSITSLTSL